MATDSVFPATPWSLIAQAADGAGEQKELLRALLERYWQPVYRTMRLGWQVPDSEAESLVHTFLLGLLDSETLSKLDPEQTRFRDFLKSKLQNFMSRYDRTTEPEAPSRPQRFELSEFVEVPDSAGDPGEIFDEQWILLVIQRAIRGVAEATRAKQPHVFAVFEAWDVRGECPADEKLAEALAIDPAAVQPALKLARRLFRRFVISEVHEYSGDQARAREELKWLLH